MIAYAYDVTIMANEKEILIKEIKTWHGDQKAGTRDKRKVRKNVHEANKRAIQLITQNLEATVGRTKKGESGRKSTKDEYTQN